MIGLKTIAYITLIFSQQLLYGWENISSKLIFMKFWRNEASLFNEVSRTNDWIEDNNSTSLMG